jgi:hypothetical protein
MPRPLMQSRIGDLERKFAAASGKPDDLQQLEHELQFRQVPRAITLLEKVRAAIDAEAATRPSVPAKPDAPIQSSTSSSERMPSRSSRVRDVQPDLWPLASATMPEAPPAQYSQQSAPAQSQPSVPPMSLADACRHLNVARGDPWEKIEQARKQIVQKSSPFGKGTPDAHRGAALAAARLANAAYVVLAVARSAASNR